MRSCFKITRFDKDWSAAKISDSGPSQIGGSIESEIYYATAMLRNLADALRNLAACNFNWSNQSDGALESKNSAQAQGEKFEGIVKDILCMVTHSRQGRRILLYETHLAYQGEKNHPPDAMYKGGDDGDAFEIKKKEKPGGALALNSSYPYSHLEKNLNRLTKKAKSCEPWTKRDIFYVVGNIVAGRSTGNRIWIVHGEVYAQGLAHYRKLEGDLKTAIANAVTSNGMNKVSTNELGKIKKVDLRDRTDLRIRGMWNIEGQEKVFGKLPGVQNSPSSHLVCHVLLTKKKWDLLLMDRSSGTKKYWQQKSAKNRVISDVQVQNPNRLNSMIACKLIRIEIPK